MVPTHGAYNADTAVIVPQTRDFVYSGQYIGIDDVVVSDQGPAKPIPALAPSWLAALSLLLAAASVVVLARRTRA